MNYCLYPNKWTSVSHFHWHREVPGAAPERSVQLQGFKIRSNLLLCYLLVFSALGKKKKKKQQNNILSVKSSHRLFALLSSTLKWIKENNAESLICFPSWRAVLTRQAELCAVRWDAVPHSPRDRAAGSAGDRGPLKPNSSSFSIYCLPMKLDRAKDFFLSFPPTLNWLRIFLELNQHIFHSVFSKKSEN